MCDFNIDLLRPHEIPQQWIDIIEGFSLTQLVQEPTKVTTNRESLLDHIYVTEPGNINQHTCSVCKSGMSDNYPTCMVHKTNGYNKYSDTTIKYRHFKNFDVEKVTNDVESLPWTILDIMMIRRMP